MDYLIISIGSLSMFQVRSLGKRKDVGTIYFCKLWTSDMVEAGTGLENHPEWKKIKLIKDPFEAINSHTKENLTIIIDDSGAGAFADYLRKMNWKVIGGSVLTDRLEDERSFATEVFSRIMKVPETNTFTDFSTGISFLKSQDKSERYVFKPNDSMTPKEYTYAGKDIEDLVETMTNFRAEWEWGEEYQLQKFVNGPLVDFGAWFNGKEWLKDSHYLYFENKPFMVSDIGMATGGDIALVYYKKNEGKFFEILNKLTPMLSKAGYIGQISINSIVSEDDKEPYFLELTPRLGYPSFPQDLTCLEDNDKYAHDLYQALANKEQKSLFSMNKACVVCVVSAPPYPNKDPLGKANDLPVSWNPEYNEYFYPYNFKYDSKKKTFKSAGEGFFLYVTCIDQTVDGATQMLYDDYIKSIHLKDMQYRTDASVDAKKRIKLLKEWQLI